MFGIWNRAETEVHRHWYVLRKDFSGNADQFYADIEAELRDRRVPDLEISRELFAEGGWLSANRVYLRIRRERLVFDICSAQFGSSWYFSCRSAVIPVSLTLLELLLFVVFLSLLTSSLLYYVGMLFTCLTLGALVVAFAAFGATAGRWQNLDDALLHVPVLGAVYELLFRRETYYRIDSRQMYLDLVDEIARHHVKAHCAAAGVQEVEFKETSQPQQPRGIMSRIKACFMSFLAILFPQESPLLGKHGQSESHH